MRSLKFVLLLNFILPSHVFASTRVLPIAEIVKLRGEASQLSPGARLARAVSLGDKLIEDTSILTGPKSFIKIKFIDDSEVNLGPESKIVITEMKKNSVGIISLLKGRIRTEVKKDTSKNSNKFFIKTRTAAMGVRGTDFQTIYNPDNKMTSLLTFTGEVAMAKVDEKTYKKLEDAPEQVVERNEVTKVPEIKEIPAKKLDEVQELNKILKSSTTVLVPPGQSSFSSESLKKTSLPVKISPIQLEALYKNHDLQEKTAVNVNLQQAADSMNFKPTLKTANQVAPAEGLYNAKTGDFAPKSGGFIDINTGLYVAPDSEAKLDEKTGTYATKKIGDIDADTGQYVAPKGLILDAKKGFILEGENEKKPELLALKEDMNKMIAKDIVVGEPTVIVDSFNINEKFIRDRIILSIWGTNQNLTSNENSTTNPYLELKAPGAVQLGFEWNMATNNRFSPIVGFDYSLINFNDLGIKGVTQTSEKLLALSFGSQYALSKSVNLFGKISLVQNHFIDQKGIFSYSLQKIVLTRLTFGVNSEFIRHGYWSVDGVIAGFITFRKRLNSVVVENGSGINLELLPKYLIGERKWLGLGLKVENQSQDIYGSNGVNLTKRKSNGLELKYIADF